MSGWRVTATELPYGDREGTWWIAADGTRSETGPTGAEDLPGRFVAWGLVDSHAHPAMHPTDGVLDIDGLSAVLRAWAATGVTVVRDVGSPGGRTLDLPSESHGPRVFSAGRFLAPPGRYFPDLLVEPVAEDVLVDAALGELDRGATWVKLIGDFPKVPEFTDNARTYTMPAVRRLCDAVHARGARVAVHTTLPDVGEFLAAGVDSIEHGTELVREDISAMAESNVAWTPTVSAALDVFRSPDVPQERRDHLGESFERFRELLPLAVRSGVKVLVGTDVVGSVAGEVANLAQLGLSPAEALAAATVWPTEFLGIDGRCDVVTYEGDPREDPDELTRPAAVVVGGIRIS